ncbi:MAG: 7,8-didemethyl-8-hydroxy-5-deazariboflavin synthase subunit CofG [Candidatus Lokiarchaeota archaeon]|nr:7,8-didemethyl-8-hydroxy-5-deazariboflavin synthase subunit CofG [Candidatus Lokiarchaeota archaeon]
MSDKIFVEKLVKKFKNNNQFEIEELNNINEISNKNLNLLSNFIFQFTRNSFKNITFSKNIFIPITHLCRNQCSYCGFREEPSKNGQILMKIPKIKKLLEKAKKFDCKEILLTFGEKPEEKYPELHEELIKMGYNSLHEYHLKICNMALEMGLLPHSNPGLLTIKELENLKEVNSSMGLMLESSSKRLCEKGGPHENSPSKIPEKRLEMIEHAGNLKIPFTTGILIGIGEIFPERVASLIEIKKLHEKYGHIQEIIIQNFLPKEGTKMENMKPIPIEQLIRTIITARLIFRDSMSIQVPPNLTLYNLDEILQVGINDLGGISPITLDEINPEMRWPSEEELKKICQRNRLKLKARLPVYPQFINSEFVSHKILKIIESY